MSVPRTCRKDCLDSWTRHTSLVALTASLALACVPAGEPTPGLGRANGDSPSLASAVESHSTRAVRPSLNRSDAPTGSESGPLRSGGASAIVVVEGESRQLRQEEPLDTKRLLVEASRRLLSDLEACRAWSTAYAELSSHSSQFLRSWRAFQGTEPALSPAIRRSEGVEILKAAMAIKLRGTRRARRTLTTLRNRQISQLLVEASRRSGSAPARLDPRNLTNAMISDEYFSSIKAMEKLIESPFRSRFGSKRQALDSVHRHRALANQVRDTETCLHSLERYSRTASEHLDSFTLVELLARSALFNLPEFLLKTEPMPKEEERLAGLYAGSAEVFQASAEEIERRIALLSEKLVSEACY